MLWYPLLHHRKTDLLILKQSICATVAAVHSKKVPELQSEPHTLSAELQLRDDDGSSGMYGSGMLVINPPWQLDCRLREILPFLAKVLTLPGNSASWKVVTE
jgi:23S rRNA (adenine2030-N6)-methyltransferase